MGALAAALGLPGLHPGHLTTRVAPSLIRGTRLRAQFLVRRTSDLRQVSHHHRLGCSASTTWPKERRGMGAFLEQREGEVLAVGLGAVAVSVVVAVARPGVVPVGVVSLAFLAAAARHQLAALFGAFAAHVNAAQDAVAVHLSSVRSNVIVWGTGNGATAQSSTVPTRDVDPEAFVKSQEEIQGVSSAEIAAALTDMAKSVAHLTMVVASLDSKITTLEKEAASRPENNNRMVIDATKPTENGIYRVQNPRNGVQLKWEEAVVKGQSVNEAKSQLLEGYKPSEVSLPFKDNVFSESRARGEQAESSQSLKFSKAESEDTSMELFFQDAGVGEEVKLDVAAVEAMELSSDSQPDVQSKENTVAQPQLMDSSSVPSGVLDGVVRNKGRWSGDYELDGSEGYRAVPTTDAKPDVLRLKRIMSGAVAANSQANSSIQNDAMGSEMTQFKVKQPVVVLATQSDAGWDDDSSVSRSNGWADEDAKASGRGGGAGRSATRSQEVRDEQGQSSRRRPRPEEGSEEILSSGKADSGQRWRREGSSGASDADFGGNGSSSESNEGGNGSRRRQSSSRKSYDSDEDRDAESPTSQGSRPSPASPSYPSERTESFRNLPEPKSGKPDDERFQKILDEVEALLKEGREGLEGRIEVGVAERMLYEAAELCEKAVELRPSSLIAVGMWGNTLLLHGELKLRLSQNLRSIMPDPPSKSLNRRAYKEAEEEIQSYEATLQDVGEECEQLLVEAGRKYRLALSMDRTDMRALYNWGLALCYRGQLIAEEGGETAAQDADKVFLAAIDKFEAMMGLSDQYAAGALLNWGLAMRDRSRLRPLGSKERQRILAQAKEIFEEALRLDPNYGQARGAVAASIVELKRLQEYEEEPQDSEDPSPSRGFRDWWG